MEDKDLVRLVENPLVLFDYFSCTNFYCPVHRMEEPFDGQLISEIRERITKETNEEKKYSYIMGYVIKRYNCNSNAEEVLGDPSKLNNFYLDIPGLHCDDPTTRDSCKICQDRLIAINSFPPTSRYQWILAGIVKSLEKTEVEKTPV